MLSKDKILSCLFFFPLVFQIFKAAAGILCSLPLRSVYSVCKLHHPQTPESQADQEEERRLATCLWPQRTAILLTGDSTCRTPSKSLLVTCVIKAIWHESWNLGALGCQSQSHPLLACLCPACTPCAARWRKAKSGRYIAPHLIVFLLFNYLLDRRRTEPAFRKNWKSWDWMAVLSYSPHSGLASGN